MNNHEKLILVLYGKPYTNRNELVKVIEQWYGWIGMVSNRYQHQLTHCENRFYDLSTSGMRENAAYSLSKYKNRIEDEIQRGNVHYIGLTSMNSHPKGYIAFDWDFTAIFGNYSQDVFMALIGFDFSIVSGWDTNQYSAFIREFFMHAQGQLWQPHYGFSALFPRRWFPLGYATGIMASGVPEELITDATAWRKFARKDCGNYLRNVFGESWLTKNHLNIPLGECSLEEYIQKTGHAGQLLDGDYNLKRWSFVNSTANLDYLRWDNPDVERLRTSLSQYNIFPYQRLSNPTA